MLLKLINNIYYKYRIIILNKMSNIIQVKSSSSSSSTNNDESDTSYIFSGSGEDDNEEDIIIKDNLINNKIKNNEDDEEEEYSNDFKKNACLIQKCGNKRKVIKLMEINKSLIRENKRLKIEEEKKENLFNTIKELQSYLNKLLPENNEEEEEVTCDEENLI
jgi:hypothetical protein